MIDEEEDYGFDVILLERHNNEINELVEKHKKEIDRVSEANIPFIKENNKLKRKLHLAEMQLTEKDKEIKQLKEQIHVLEKNLAFNEQIELEDAK